MRQLFLLGLLLFTTRPGSAADPFESWHSFDLPLLRAGRLNSQFHSQFRTRNRFQDVYQARFGATTRLQIPKNLIIVSGFWYTIQQRVARDRWDDQHRAWGGIERTVRAGAGAVTLRSLYERWYGGFLGRTDNRTRWLVSYRRPIGMGLVAGGGAETFTDKRGYMAERLSCMIALPVARRWSAEFGYFWDARLDRVGGGRQVLTTTFRARQRDQ